MGGFGSTSMRIDSEIKYANEINSFNTKSDLNENSLVCFSFMGSELFTIIPLYWGHYTGNLREWYCTGITYELNKLFHFVLVWLDVSVAFFFFFFFSQLPIVTQWDKTYSINCIRGIALSLPFVERHLKFLVRVRYVVLYHQRFSPHTTLSEEFLLQKS